MRAPEFFYKKSFFNLILSLAISPLSLIWILIYLIGSFSRFIKRSKFKSSKRIICIGNLTMGGTGKTEIALSIGREFFKKGIKFCFLTKGYKRKTSEDIFLKRNFQVEDYSKYGDEAILLSKVGDVFITSNRIRTIKTIEELDYDYIIMDDGIHDSSFKKDLSIVLFDNELLNGNGFIFPSGAMRCPLSFFKRRIDCIIYTNKRNKNKSNLAEKLKCKNVFYSEIKYKEIDKFFKYVAFSGLGINRKFFDFLRQIGMNLIKEVEFSDHHKYTDKEIENVLDIVKNANADYAITTAKDFVKINEKYHKYIKQFEIYHEIDSEFFKMFDKIHYIDF